MCRVAGRRSLPLTEVSTHFLPAEIIAWLRSNGRLATRQAIMVTDFDVQGIWLTHHVDRYFVALEETRIHLERLGVPWTAITVSGIPIDPVFAEPKDARAMVPWSGRWLSAPPGPESQRPFRHASDVSRSRPDPFGARTSACGDAGGV